MRYCKCACAIVCASPAKDANARMLILKVVYKQLQKISKLYMPLQGFFLEYMGENVCFVLDFRHFICFLDVEFVLGIYLSISLRKLMVVLVNSCMAPVYWIIFKEKGLIVSKLKHIVYIEYNDRVT